MERESEDMKAKIKKLEEEAKDPPLFKKLMFSGSVEQEAMQALVARKKIEQQEKELRELIVYKWGVEEYTAMMRDRAKIKDTRERAMLNQRRKIRKFIANTLTIIVIAALTGLLVMFIVGIITNLR